MNELHFDFRDVLRAGRYGFSAKKMSVHFFGLVVAYLIYEVLVYLSLIIAGGQAVGEFWNTYALLPICPIVDYGLKPITVGAMWLGLFVFFLIFFSTSTMVSKITIQQLRGDSFFSIRDSVSFFKKHWKGVFGAFVGLILLLLLCMLVPIVIGLVGKIPWIGKVVVMCASLLMPFAFVLGLLMVFLLLTLAVSLFLVPAIVAAADADAFETVWQHISIIWHQPWRMALYESLLFGLKLICVPIWGAGCLIGFTIVMLPVRNLVPRDVIYFMEHANSWLGSIVEAIGALPLIDSSGVFDTVMPSDFLAVQLSRFDIFFMTLSSIFLMLSFLCIMGLVVAYLFSIASAGNTVIYTILRRRVGGDNLLDSGVENDLLPGETMFRENTEENESENPDDLPGETSEDGATK